MATGSLARSGTLPARSRRRKRQYGTTGRCRITRHVRDRVTGLSETQASAACGRHTRVPYPSARSGQNLLEDSVSCKPFFLLALAVAAPACGRDAGMAALTGLPAANVGTTTVAFKATVKGPMTLPVGCDVGVTSCGTASIAGIGSADFTYAITGFQPLGGSCGAYTATATFTLADASSLVLDESGTVCGPGKSFFFQPAPGGSYGNPVNGTGTWTVHSASGQFSGMNFSGSNSFHQAGASLAATYLSGS
jgi:hypothetical protein